MEIKKIMKYAIWAYIISFCVYELLSIIYYSTTDFNIYSAYLKRIIPMIPIIIALLMNKPEVSLISIVLYIGISIFNHRRIFFWIKDFGYI